MRTDQTRLCTECRLRFSRGRSCPSCGAKGLDLRGPLDRQAAFEKLRRPARWRLPRPSSGCLVFSIVTAIIVLTFVVGAALIVVFRSPMMGIVAYFAVPTVCTLIWALGFPEAHQLPKRPAPPERWATVELHAFEIDDGEPAVEGEVRADETLTSPLSGVACVAFRLVGRVGPMAIDDGGMVPFEVKGEAGSALVESKDGCVALETEDPVPVEPNAALRAFLSSRGLIEGEPLELAESVLRAGDRAAVRGARSERDRARGDGYRGTETVTVFRDAPDRPLVLRAASQ